MKKMCIQLCTYFPVFREVDLQGFGVVFESERCHGKEDILPIDSLAFLSLTLLRSYIVPSTGRQHLPSHFKVQ